MVAEIALETSSFFEFRMFLEDVDNNEYVLADSIKIWTTEN